MVLLTGVAGAARAQNPAKIRDRVIADSLIQRSTRVKGAARVEESTGTARAVYEPAGRRRTPESFDAAARAVLKADRRFGWTGTDEDLRIIDERRSPGGRHLTYQQYMDGVPVLGRYTRVSFDHSGRSTFVVNGFAPHLESVPDFNPIPGISRDAAHDAASGVFVDGVTRLSDTELVVLATDPPSLVWRTLAWPETSGEFEILVDARTGDVSSVRDLTLHRASHMAGGRTRPPRPVLAAPAIETYGAGTMVDGQGMIFDPDPLASSGKSYEPPYVDADDQDVPELNAERKLVSLPEITLGPDQLYRLIGPHVEVTGRRSNGQVNYTPPEEASPTAFSYTRGDERFESVMVYHHIDKSQRYVQSLGFDDVENSPLPVNPFGEGNADVSNYYLGLDYLALGAGGVDDGEDAFVIWHEYAHALLNSQVPGLANNFEGTAFHEGWSDYWAASYQREMFETGKLPQGDWRRLFRWDGNNAAIGWFGRQLPQFKVYPDDMTRSSVHTDGLIWASAMMAVYDRLGRQLTDQLNIQSHYYLTAPATMEDAAYALIQADVDLHSGEHTGDLVAVLAPRGFVDASTFKTIVTHEPLPDTEQLGGTVHVAVDVTAIVTKVTSVTVYYEGTGISGSLSLTTGDGIRYEGLLPLPETPSVVSYYIETVDDQSQVVRLPEGAPGALFGFVAGPDSEAPQIHHTPLSPTSIYGWPPTVRATVEDNIALDTVFVNFTIKDNSSSIVLQEGGFGLEGSGSSYVGAFPAADFALRGREIVEYRIYAIDASAAANTAVLPATAAPFTFALALSGTVRSFDFDSDVSEVDVTGIWERGTPGLGPSFAHSGSSAWVTDLDDSYPATQSIASLTLPSVDIHELESAWLSFWHWYDTEHDGTSDPGSNHDAVLWDGGNVMVSVDDGSTWNILTPEGGYDGTISAGGGNPKNGEPAFGGYSYGWRRELVQIPGGSSVTIRFEFGTDVSNEETSVAFAGWMIDDVAIEVERPVDDTSPSVIEAPPLVTEVVAGPSAPPTTATIVLTDDTGIERVTATYDIAGPAGSGSGSVRLDMSSNDPSIFWADLPIPSGLAVAGASIEYRIVASDFDGNLIRSPAGDQRFAVRYIYKEALDVAAMATPSGGWKQLNGGWHIDASTHTGSRASLVFPPMDLPVDASSMGLEVTHSYRLQSGAGGRMAATVADAEQWAAVEPDGGYPGEATGFIGQADEIMSVFPLDSLPGRHVWFRLDLFAQQPLSPTDFWDITSVRLVYKAAASSVEIPRSLELHQNYPNPFSVSTTFSYSVPAESNVRVEAFDLLGRRVETLRDGVQEEGVYTVRWQPRLAPGIYVIRLAANGQEKLIKVTLIR